MSDVEYVKVVGNNLEQRGCHALEMGQWADCKFLVGEDKEEIQACRLLLALASPVFEAMFCGDLASTEAVEVPDIEPQVFKQLLKFIYCHQLKLSSSEEAFALFSAAHKYMMPDLCELCTSYIVHCMDSADTKFLFDTFKFACVYNNKDLKQFVLQGLRDKASALLEGPEVQKLDAESLILVLQQCCLNVKSEIEVIEAVTLWAQARCEEKGLPVEGYHLREILMDSGVLRHVRFLTLTKQQLEDLQVKSGILTSEDILPILEYKYMCCSSNIPEYLCPISKCRLNLKESNKYHITGVKRDLLEIEQGAVFKWQCEKKKTGSQLILQQLTLGSQAPEGPTATPTCIYDEEVSVTVYRGSDTYASGFFKGRAKYNSHIHVPLHLECMNNVIYDGQHFIIEVQFHKSGKYSVYSGNNGDYYIKITSTWLSPAKIDMEIFYVVQH